MFKDNGVYFLRHRVEVKWVRMCIKHRRKYITRQRHNLTQFLSSFIKLEIEDVKSSFFRHIINHRSDATGRTFHTTSLSHDLSA